jgi:hypothetical protein
MTALRQAAEEYLAMRRALGFKLTTQGRQLMSFVEFCEARGAEHVTTEFALAWATQTSRGSSDEVYRSRRLMVVRIFARHLAALDPATEVPPEDMLPHHYRRIAPAYTRPPRSPR